MRPQQTRRQLQLERIAFRITRFLQAIIGIGLALLIIIKLVLEVIAAIFHVENFGLDGMKLLHNAPTLRIIATGLVFSAALELAYMLLTPDLDEAVDPLILGLAATIIFRIEAAREVEKVKDMLPHAGQIVIYIVALMGLFVIREIFIKRRWFRGGIQDFNAR